MEKKEKLKGFQKLALERIYRLFELAENADKEHQKRYLELAGKIGTGTRVKIPKELKKKYCRKCFGMNITAKKETESVVISCNNCKSKKKYSSKKE